MHPRNLTCERPPRPLHFGGFAPFFLMSRPPLLCKEGNSAPMRDKTGSPSHFLNRDFTDSGIRTMWVQLKLLF